MGSDADKLQETITITINKADAIWMATRPWGETYASSRIARVCKEELEKTNE